MKHEKKVEKLRKAFLAWLAEEEDRDESDKIELDNLDMARLTLDENDEVVVENEHGTQFELSELSDMEISIFMIVL